MSKRKKAIPRKLWGILSASIPKGHLPIWSGLSSPSLKTLIKLSEAFGVSCDFLLTGAGKSGRSQTLLLLISRLDEDQQHLMEYILEGVLRFDQEELPSRACRIAKSTYRTDPNLTFFLLQGICFFFTTEKQRRIQIFTIRMRFDSSSSSVLNNAE